VRLFGFIIRIYHDARSSECQIWETLSYFNNDKRVNGAEHCGYAYVWNVIGICDNENQREKIHALITKLNKYNTLFSRNSHYKFLSENSLCFRRVINKNVTIKLKCTTHIYGNTLLHVSIPPFICYDMLSWNRLSLRNSFVA